MQKQTAAILKGLQDCKTKEDYIAFFDNDERALRHTDYYHYSTIDSIDNILTTKRIRLTQLSKTANDRREKQHYRESGDNLFSICFSTGTSESLPLWYLYSGIDGKGGRLCFRKKHIKTLISNMDVYLVEVDSEYPYRIVNNCEKKLDKKDYRIYARDIAYLGKDTKNKNAFRLKYNAKVVNGLKQEEHDYIEDKYAEFIKGLIWFYEKETRLQVKILNKDLLESSKNEPGKTSYAVEIGIEDIISDIDLRLAPEFTEEDISDVISKPGIRDFLNSKIQQSDYIGEIEMGITEKICKHCQKRNVK